MYYSARGKGQKEVLNNNNNKTSLLLHFPNSLSVKFSNFLQFSSSVGSAPTSTLALTCFCAGPSSSCREQTVETCRWTRLFDFWRTSTRNCRPRLNTCRGTETCAAQIPSTYKVPFSSEASGWVSPQKGSWVERLRSFICLAGFEISFYLEGKAGLF